MVTAALSSETDAEYERLETVSIPGNPHRATRWRWALRGVVKNDKRVKLRTVVIGGRRYTTPAWVSAFIADCTDDPAPAAMTPARRERQAAAAMDSLRSMGVR